MMKNFPKLFTLLIAIAGLSSCGVSPSPENNDEPEQDIPEEPQKEEFDMNLIEDSKPSKIVKDYSYMYHLDGLKNPEKDRLAFFSDNYQMLIDARSANLLGLKSTNKEEMVDPNALDAVTSTFEIEINNNKHRVVGSNEGRIIDSGRYVNRYDNVTLRFNGLDQNNYFGRIEYAANRDYVAFNYELYSLVNVDFKLSATFTLEGYQLSRVDDRNVIAVDSDGNGFIFAKQTADDVELVISNNSLIINKSITNYVSKHFQGLGVMIVPYYRESTDCYDRFIANEKVLITAQTRSGSSLAVNYDATDGIYYIDHGDVVVAANSNIYDDINININNQGATAARPIICFIKTKNVSITGVSPMMVDAETYEPTGEQVQISKNWHTYTTNTSDFNYAASDSPKRLYQGPWLHSYTRINVESKKEEARVFLLAYGRWGETFASSHAQLCLIGYGGLQVWDQSALGSWGESVTYDPDICLGRSMVDDVRPFLVTGPTGGNMQYNWTGNVGGADFLRYSDSDGSYNIINQRLSYITQAPNITNVNYSGNTSDGKIKTSVTINMGRTDDIPRNYYTLEYEFLEDVTFNELVLFKLCANGYADNWFTKYAYGDINGIIASDLSATGNAENVAHTAENSDFFFGLYNSTNAEENGDVMCCVREYEATINGVVYQKPGYKFVNTNNGSKQMACEIGLPAECNNVVKKGSKVRLVIEYDVLPNSDTYYGTSIYIQLTKNLMGTADEFYQQVFGGKFDLKVTDGELVSTYPINIYSKGNDKVEFSLSGGLGYTPLLMDGLSSYKGYKLQMKVNGEYIDIDQSSDNYEKDFYQCYFNERTGKYQLGYNIFNTKGTNFAGAKNEYRLIKENK